MTETTPEPTRTTTETTGTQTPEGESVDTLRQCVRLLEKLPFVSRKRVSEYLWAWVREPDRSKALE